MDCIKQEIFTFEKGHYACIQVLECGILPEIFSSLQGMHHSYMTKLIKIDYSINQAELPCIHTGLCIRKILFKASPN